MRRALITALRDALASEAATMSHGAEALAAATPRPRRLSDLIDIRSARALGDRADFFLQRRGDASRVGRPIPLSARDDWNALPPVEVSPAYWGDMPPRAWKTINPEHHYGVRVKDRRIDPQVIYDLMTAIHRARARDFGASGHGTTRLVNIVLRDLKRLYDIDLPAPKAKRLFKARLQNAATAGFGSLDLRPALQALLRGRD